MGAPRALLLMVACVVALTGSAASGCSGVGTDVPTPVDPSPTIDGGEASVLSVTSAAFGPNATIPARYCRSGFPGGLNVSPPLAWSDAPADTRSFVVTMIDLNQRASEWVHWAIVDVPPETVALPEGASGSLASPARELANTFGEGGYGGPQPPFGSGAHTYAITVYAVDVASLGIEEEPTAEDLRRALDGHVLASGTLSGVVGR